MSITARRSIFSNKRQNIEDEWAADVVRRIHQSAAKDRIYHTKQEMIDREKQEGCSKSSDLVNKIKGISNWIQMEPAFHMNTVDLQFCTPNDETR